MRSDYCPICQGKIRKGEKTEYHPDPSGNNDSWYTHIECPRINVRKKLEAVVREKQAELNRALEDLARVG